MPTGYTTVSATNLCDATGTVIANATISFKPVDNKGRSLSFRAGGTSQGQAISQPVTTTVTNGAFSITLADTTLTTPVNVGYAVTVIDNVSGDCLLSNGYQCVQPSGATWSFDSYVPNFAAQVTAQVGATGLCAYRVWLSAGNSGTEADYIASLKGLPGADASMGNIEGTTPLTVPAIAGPTMVRALTPSSNNAVVLNNGSNNQDVYIRNDTGQPLLIESSNGLTFDVPQHYFDGYGRVTLPANTLGLVYRFVYDLPNTIWRLQGVTAALLEPALPTVYAAEMKQVIVTSTAYDVATSTGSQLIRIQSGQGSDNYCQIEAGGITYAAELWIVNESGSTVLLGSQVGFDGPTQYYDQYGRVVLPARADLVYHYIYDTTNNLWRCKGITSSTIVPTAPVNVIQSDGSLLSAATVGNDMTTRSLMMDPSKNGQTPSSFRYPFTDRTGAGYGDSITAGVGSSVATSTAWLAVMQAYLGIPNGFANRGVPSDMAEDMANHVFNYENPTATSKAVYTTMIGTNNADVAAQGAANNTGVPTPAMQSIFQKTHLASLSWLATRAEDKVQGGSATMGTGFTADTTFAAVTGATSTTNGSTLTFNLTTHGGPIYLYSRIMTGNTGAFSVTVDGGTPLAVSTAPDQPIATLNSGTTSVQMTRIPVAAGSHTIVVTVTSATGSSNVVTIVAVATPSDHVYYTNPRVLAMAILPQENNAVANISGTYNQWVMDDVALLLSDGLDIVVGDSRKVMQNGLPALYHDVVHPNDLGHAAISYAAAIAFQTPPARSVRRSVPLAGGKGTPGDVWAANGNIYGVMADQSIHYTATTGTV